MEMSCTISFEREMNQAYKNCIRLFERNESKQKEMNRRIIMKSINEQIVPKLHANIRLERNER